MVSRVNLVYESVVGVPHLIALSVVQLERHNAKIEISEMNLTIGKFTIIF